MRKYIWNYNTRTGLGEITYLDGMDPRYEIVTGSNARGYDETFKDGRRIVTDCGREDLIHQSRGGP